MRAQLVALAPLALVALTAVAELLLISFHRGERAPAWLAGLGLLVAAASLPAAARTPGTATSLLTVDGYAVFFVGLVLAAALSTMIFANGAPRDDGPGELYVLVLLAALGAAVLAASVHFASFFLGLEILSVSLYALIGDRGESSPLGQRSLEAALKYLVLAGVSSAFLLFGMALVYAELGSLEFARLASLGGSGAQPPALVLAGLALMMVGVGFKLALVPFHLWTPDVYQGAPAPVTAFVATASKGGVFAVLVRLFAATHAATVPSLVLAVSLIAGLSMSVGNLLALLQTSLKRLLAYSSIAQLGYLLVALLARPPLAVEAACYYLAAYVLTMLLAFGVVSALSAADREADALDDYRGLYWRRPALAAALTIALLSLAAIPLTGGFVGKVYVVAAGAASSLWALLVVLAVNSAIGLYYYLRVIVTLYSPVEGERAGEVRVARATSVTLTALVVALVWLGVQPAPLIRLLSAAAAPAITAPAP
jgi:NADH-quinone oxidoreductase subunit N